MTKRAYFTTPIYYVNASPHIGHSYTTILGDVTVRYHRLLGYETYYQTGTDEHGDKVMRAAEERGETPQAYVDKISARFRDLWPRLEVEYDDYIRTTEERHKVVVRQVLQDLYDKGEIYSATYGGHYCTGCERYLTEKELVEGKCPDHDSAPEWIEEQNYFFKMSKYQDWLIKHIEDHPDFIRPELHRNRVLSFLREPLKDLSISRPRKRVPWGIPFPFDEDHVCYVWFDALLNYISAPGYPDGETYRANWPVVQHFVAKDILVPHAIYWPTMLKAAGIPIYQHLNVHGWWMIDQQKMSKSLGNVVAPLELADKYGVDAFRYFLIREMQFGQDADFNELAFVSRLNSELADDLGNLVGRLTAMIGKYCGGEIPAAEEEAPDAETLQDIEERILGPLEERVLAMDLHAVLESVIDGTRRLNKYVTDQTPWTLAKNQETGPLHALLYHTARLLGVIGQVLRPVMPLKGAELLSAFGLEHPPPTIVPDAIVAGLTVKRGIVLFPKQEPPTIGETAPAPEAPAAETKPAAATTAAPAEPPKDAPAAAPAAPAPSAAPLKPAIEFDDFAKLDLRVAKVITAERVPKTDRLLRLELDDGSGQPRQIVAGIAEHIAPESLPGQQVVIVANLKPRKLRGIESQGMLLAAHGANGLRLLTPAEESTPGATIS